MDTRMYKYEDDKSNMSRVARNRNVYEEINNQEIDNFPIRNNARVIGNQQPEMDIEQIKKILDKKYNEVPQRKSIKLEETLFNEEITREENTKEYDLNTVLATAKNRKEETYEEARAKRLRDTQFDILKKLNIPEEKEEEQPADEDLLNLINTISINEDKVKEINDTKEQKDILSDLEEDDIKEDDIKEDGENEEDKTKLDNSFYATQDLFKETDFADEEIEDDNKLSIGLKFVIAVLIVAFIIGMYIFVKSYLKY